MNNKIVGTKNSHKYFPEFMAKSFYGKNPIKYLDASTGEIVIIPSSNEFNAEYGYYTDKNEKILNEKAEQKFQQFARKIEKIARSGKRDISQLKIAPDIIYDFFAYQILRDPTYCNAMLKILYENRAISEEQLSLVQDFQNEAIVAESKIQPIALGLKETFLIVIEPNFAEMKYISVNTPVMKTFSDGKMCVLAVSPNVAFCLVSYEIAKMLGIKKSGYTVRDDGADFVIGINECIMAHAITYPPYIVLGTDAEELKKLRSAVKTKIDLYN